MSAFRGVTSAAWAAIGCAAALAVSAPAAGADVRLERVGPAFDTPVHVAGAPGDGERLYVVQQGGIVKVLKGGVASDFANLRDVVQFSGEQGLLSIAFPPDFQTSRLFYVYYTGKDGDNRVDELRAPTDDAADPASRRTVLTLDHPGADNHNGGQLQFGPDGMLYVAPGDGGIGRSANAQNLDSPLGKILRIDPRGGVVGSYTVPADNPFSGQGGTRPLVWSYGLRNPYRFSFDRATGDLVVGDVGENTTEEVDWLPASSGAGRGANFGWNVCEGSFATGSRTTPCGLTGSVRPILDKFHGADGWASIIAGYVVRDPSLPSLYGRLVYGDYFKSALRSVVPSDPSSDRELPGVSVNSLTSFGEDAGGCVYATSGVRDGAVYRLVEDDARVPCAPGGGGTPPPTGGGGGNGGGEDSGGRGAAPLRVGWKRLQRVLRNGGVVVHARCATACRLGAAGSMRAGRRTFRLKTVRRTARAERKVRLLVPLTKPARTALRSALLRGGRPTFAIRVRAREAGGTTVLRRAAVRAKR
jgi:hypothetical protein